MITFTLPIGGFSVNACYGKNAKYKTKDFRDWELAVLRLLNKVDTSGFSAHCAAYEVHLNFVYPKDIYYNAQGKISARTKDISNVEKPIIDLLFQRWLGPDDRLITTMISTKGPGDDYAIEVTVLEADAQPDTKNVI